MAKTRQQKNKSQPEDPPVAELSLVVAGNRGRPPRKTTGPAEQGQQQPERGENEVGAPQAKKRGRPAKAKVPVTENPPATEESDDGVPPPKKPRKAAIKSKVQAAVTPREPLPGREGRNLHPGKQSGVAAAPRRKPGEAAAARAEKKKAAEEDLRKKEAARRALAEMDVAEEEEDAEMDAESTQRLSAALRSGYYGREPESGSEGESFDFAAVDMEVDDSESESNVEEPVRKSKVRRLCMKQYSSLLDYTSRPKALVQRKARTLSGARSKNLLKDCVVVGREKM